MRTKPKSCQYFNLLYVSPEFSLISIIVHILKDDTYNHRVVNCILHGKT